MNLLNKKELREQVLHYYLFKSLFCCVKDDNHHIIGPNCSVGKTLCKLCQRISHTANDITVVLFTVGPLVNHKANNLPQSLAMFYQAFSGKESFRDAKTIEYEELKLALDDVLQWKKEFLQEILIDKPPWFDCIGNIYGFYNQFEFAVEGASVWCKAKLLISTLDVECAD